MTSSPMYQFQSMNFEYIIVNPEFRNSLKLVESEIFSNLQSSIIFEENAQKPTENGGISRRNTQHEIINMYANELINSASLVSLDDSKKLLLW